MMDLTLLHPNWLIDNKEKIGFWFDCPLCLGSTPHRISIQWISTDNFPHGLLWEKVSGNTFEDITLSPSVRFVAGCKFHGWIRRGVVSW